MSYQFILPEDIFIYKALPNPMCDRVEILPRAESDSDLIVEIEDRNGRMGRDVEAVIDWVTLPDRRITGNGFMDELARSVHFFGARSMGFFAKRLTGQSSKADADKHITRIQLTATQLSSTIYALSGLHGSHWVARYTMLMAIYIEKHTSLRNSEIAKLLRFSSNTTYAQFMRTWRTKKDFWKYSAHL